jgi:RNA polymerase sigma-70 factor (ECF subfamily)
MTNPKEDLIDTDSIAEGDAQAFTKIYNIYWERVYGFAYRMTGDQTTAEDVTHEAFLVLIRHPKRYHPERGSMMTFLCAVARNCIFHHFRRRGYEIDDAFDEQSSVSTFIATEKNPLNYLLERELAEKVNESVALLPVLQREVLILREFQELSYEEIAAVVGGEVNVVKARLYRARQTLAKRLAPYMTVKGERCYELPGS